MLVKPKKNNISEEMAIRIAEIANHWWEVRDMHHPWQNFKDPGKNIITYQEVMMLQAIKISQEGGYEIYPIQWGDVTLLFWLRSNGDISFQRVFW